MSRRPCRPRTGCRRLRTGFLVGAGGLQFLRLVTLVVNSAVFPRLRLQSRKRVGTVSLLVPARGEEHHLPELMHRLAAQHADEVIICDDGDNGDGLAQAEALGIRVITPGPRPRDWVGKNWACHNLACAASGDVLVFTDADTVWEPGALDSILALRRRLGVELLSVVPRSTRLPWGARLLTPLVETIYFSLVPWPLLTLDRFAKGAAHGALMAFTREGYDLCGGHELAHGQILEDVWLARATQAAGGRSRVVYGGRLLGVAMYRSYQESVDGAAKSVLAIHDGSRARTLGSLLAFFTLTTLPWLLPTSRGMWALRGASVADRVLVNLAAGRRAPADLAEGLLGPVVPLAVVPAVVKGMRRKLVWKGRVYSEETARPLRMGRPQ